MKVESWSRYALLYLQITAATNMHINCTYSHIHIQIQNGYAQYNTDTWTATFQYVKCTANILKVSKYFLQELSFLSQLNAIWRQLYRI